MDVQETLVELLNELSELNAQYTALQEEFLISEYSHTDDVSESVSRGLDHLDLFSSGDTGFVLSCSALAMFLTLPGISLFYSGAVSIKHVMSTFIQTMAVSAVISVLWMLCGYSLAYSPSQFDINDKTTIYGDLSRGWLLGMDIDSVHQLSPTIPETAFCMFQLTHAIFACAFVIGGFACRTKFLSVLVFMSLWLLLVYCPLSHMLMHPSGWLFKADVLDFTGSNVTHISAGITALVASYYIGPRTNIQEKERFESRNILLSVWGACFVLVGWFGFNMGSSYGSGIAASRALFGSMLGASSSSVSWISVEWLRTGSPSILGILCGAIAGLVSISAGIGYIDHTGVVVTGACAGFSCYMVVEKVKRIHSVDDPLNTFSMNFVGGLVGGFLVGFFAKLDAGGTRSHPTGAFYGNANQIYIQLLGIAVTTAWSAVVSGCILLFLDMTIGLRVPKVHEKIGLDVAQLHETIIAMPTNKMQLLIDETIFASKSKREEDTLDVLNHGDINNSDGNGDISGNVDDEAVSNSVTTSMNNETLPRRIYTQKSILSGND